MHLPVRIIYFTFEDNAFFSRQIAPTPNDNKFTSKDNAFTSQDNILHY
jgi:hypothetical protein